MGPLFFFLDTLLYHEKKGDSIESRRGAFVSDDLQSTIRSLQYTYIDGLITEETLNNILDEAVKLYGKYDEEYGIGLAEHCYEWNDINGHAMAFRYSPEDERQFYITWADSSNEQDTIMLY